jgi:hypothetical protein
MLSFYSGVQDNAERQCQGRDRQIVFRPIDARQFHVLGQEFLHSCAFCEPQAFAPLSRGFAPVAELLQTDYDGVLLPDGLSTPL